MDVSKYSDESELYCRNFGRNSPRKRNMEAEEDRAASGPASTSTMEKPGSRLASRMVSESDSPFSTGKASAEMLYRPAGALAGASAAFDMSRGPKGAKRPLGRSPDGGRPARRCLHAWLSGLRPRQQRRSALQAGLRPQLGGLVVLGRCRHTRRQHDPWLFRRGENVNIGRHPVGFIKCANSDKTNGISAASVVAVALRAARDLLPLPAVRGSVDDYNLALQKLHAISFDHGVQRE
jgi:hypothetical protein